MAIGKQFLSATIAENSIADYLQNGNIAHLFRPNEAAVAAFVAEFVKQYGALPKIETIEAHTGETLVKHSEPAAYYLDLMKVRYVELSVKQAMKQASDLLLPQNKDPLESLKVLTTMAVEMARQQNQHMIHDFRDAYDLIVPHYVAQYTSPEAVGLMLGWPYIDNMTGGLLKGDLLSFIGRPQLGKTWLMLYSCSYGWLRALREKEPTLKEQLLSTASRMFVSMEMNKLAIEQRMAAMVAQVPASQLKHAALSTIGLKKLKDGLLEVKGLGAPFWVVDGNLTAMVEDIWMLARQLKPHGIWIDGGYLLKHPTERDRFRRVAENTDLIKTELCPLAPVAASWQFAKTADDKKKKKGEKAGLVDIGYTDAIAQLSSVVLGITEDESVETLISRLLDVIKGRNGEVGSFRTRWDHIKMDFSQIETEKVEELQFI